MKNLPHLTGNSPQSPVHQPGKVIIIGATSGIGRELAKLYAGKGYSVVASGRRNDLLYSLQSEWPNNIDIECFDVTAGENVAHLQNMIRKSGGVDIIIYSSGYGEISDGLEWEIEKQTTAVNVSGFVEIVCYAFNYFARQGYGHIACISSIAAIRGNADAPAYNAGKAFQSNYIEGLYLKAKKIKVNITVTDIRPGFVDTDMAKGDKKFWVSAPHRAAQQIFNAIIAKRKVAYVTRRWQIVAVILKYLPGFIYRIIGT